MTDRFASSLDRAVADIQRAQEDDYQARLDLAAAQEARTIELYMEYTQDDATILEALGDIANGFGDLHEIRRVDVGAVVDIGLRGDPVRIHLEVHALHRGVFLVIEDDRHDRQVVIARGTEAAERRLSPWNTASILFPSGSNTKQP